MNARLDGAFPVRVLAPNPGPFTLDGTNTWIVGHDPAFVIDPGPDDPAHVAEVVRSAGRVRAVLLTHRHPDHEPAAAAMAAATGAPILAFAPGPGEEPLSDGQEVVAGGAALRVLHTPGHTPDHVAFHDPSARILFTGDAVLGRGTSVIDPPEGDLVDYLRSLEAMRSAEALVLCPGHGPVLWHADDALRGYLHHREERERQVLEALSAGPSAPADLVPVIYAGYPEELYPAAARSVLAHLLKLEREGRVRARGGRFALIADSGTGERRAPGAQRTRRSSSPPASSGDTT